ncbi:unnamed protein product [Effrenium voratum]|uniref:RAP domain-containing protein n=1 Tax=Effrenium voratum TaxID=2562239 RepID=A0AA36I911_9DINO|nr:unnamed protein product [Effrenium voratum]CAJ1441327.1 unnamed protein product [Effrenium voratum]
MLRRVGFHLRLPPSHAAPAVALGRRVPAPVAPAAPARGFAEKVHRQRLLDGGEEILTEEEKVEKDNIIKDLTKRLSGPLADEHGNIPTGEDRPIAIEVDGPSHFYANSKRYTAYTKLKHRLLTRMGYKVLHVPYFDWRQLRSAKDREDYMRAKLKEEPTEWLDPDDEKYYMQGPDEGEDEFSVEPDKSSLRPAPTPQTQTPQAPQAPPQAPPRAPQAPPQAPPAPAAQPPRPPGPKPSKSKPLLPPEHWPPCPPPPKRP